MDSLVRLGRRLDAPSPPRPPLTLRKEGTSPPAGEGEVLGEAGGE